MFDWDLYKKNIIIIGISILLISIGWFWYYYFNNYKNIEVKKMWNNQVNIKIDKAKKEIKLVNKTKENLKNKNPNKYSYQVKVYLNKYDLSCNWEKNICKKILANKSKLNNFILWNYSWELKKLDEFKLNLNKFFEEKFDENIFKYNIIDLLYNFQNNFIKESNIKKTWFEKYFKFKLKSGEKNIVLNNMEVQCASEIKMSVIPWTFEEDKIISKKVEENCKNLWWEKLLTLNNNKIDKSKITLDFIIKNLKVKYIFFEKKDWKYIKIENKEINVDYEKKFILKKQEEKNKQLTQKFKNNKKENKNLDNIITDVKKEEKEYKEKENQKYIQKMNEILLKKKFMKKMNNILLQHLKKKK